MTSAAFSVTSAGASVLRAFLPAETGAGGKAPERGEDLARGVYSGQDLGRDFSIRAGRRLCGQECPQHTYFLDGA